MSDVRQPNLSFDSFPVTWSVTHRKLGLVVLTVAVAVPGLPLWFLAGSGRAILLFVGIPALLLVFLPLALWGLNLLFAREKFTLTPGELSLAKDSLFGSQSWTKNLSALTLMNVVSHSRSGDRRHKLITRYTTMLVHEKPGSEFEAELDCTQDFAAAQQRLEQIAEKLPVKVDRRLFHYNLGVPVDD